MQDSSEMSILELDGDSMAAVLLQEFSVELQLNQTINVRYRVFVSLLIDY